MSEVATYYRIVKRQYVDDAFSGDGSMKFGGRWNPKGVPCVYAAGSASLATLETLVHLQATGPLPTFILLTIDVPVAEVRYLAEKDLPSDWRDDPPPLSTMRLGKGWIDSGDGVALVIPSTIIPIERNVILNVSHPAFKGCLGSVKPAPFELDQRLLK
ncbi:RES family NAD+ phosphorylase [Halopseudomonas xiamenensis]|uniref:RES family NAD+ phosphorylase n=1 Tax=Halopseudomonas xiamenensis TaxID=157792 RepID=UPI001623DB03|nr:RES domain-containing protein [Halopseudomonas xiamenensis]